MEIRTSVNLGEKGTKETKQLRERAGGEIHKTANTIQKGKKEGVLNPDRSITLHRFNCLGSVGYKEDEWGVNWKKGVLQRSGR